MQIEGHHVVVTGASRGIGKGIAREFAARGGRVTLVARTASTLEALAEEIGGHALPADLFDREQVSSLIERAESEAGPVDILVNNAGMEHSKSFFDITEVEVDEVVALNVSVPIELTRQVLPGMRDRGRGHVLNISSMAANGALPGFAVYSATKAGLSHFTRALRQDLKGLALGVTTLEVGPVPTDIMENLAYEPALAGFARLRRLQLLPDVSVERVARAAANGVERNKRAVWLPRRASLFGALTGAPQRIVEPLVADIK
jgi:uncharacterized protein